MAKKTYRSPKNPPKIDKVQTFTKGWYRDISEKFNQLRKEVSGLNERVNSVQNRKYTEYQECLGIPASYTAHKVFQPGESVITLAVDDAIQDLGSADGLTPPGITTGNLSVNQILRSGDITTVNVPMYGDGVFVAKQLSVAIYNRIFVPGQGEMFRHVSQKSVPENSQGSVSGNYQASTLRYSIASAMYWNGNGTTEYSTLNRVNYFWNIIDRSSGRRLADYPMPSTVLLDPTELVYRNAQDGDLFTFDVPWIFERDSQLEFEFQPIIDFYQVDPGSGVLPFGFDDRENGGASRNNSIIVKVEVHGEKYLTKRDALRNGAHFWQRDDSLAFGPGGTIRDANNFPGE